MTPIDTDRKAAEASEFDVTMSIHMEENNFDGTDDAGVSEFRRDGSFSQSSTES